MCHKHGGHTCNHMTWLSCSTSCVRPHYPWRSLLDNVYIQHSKDCKSKTGFPLENQKVLQLLITFPVQSSTKTYSRMLFTHPGQCCCYTYTCSRLYLKKAHLTEFHEVVLYFSLLSTDRYFLSHSLHPVIGVASPSTVGWLILCCCLHSDYSRLPHLFHYPSLLSLWAPSPLLLTTCTNHYVERRVYFCCGGNQTPPWKDKWTALKCMNMHACWR